ncbi:peptide-methionine (S)-S-oxide reductase MsrA [Pedomonas sp. V897]|uniref:peptide-methionine (S)-S-oxide reductase MsrA n=1 Tax=Pedomonas sp. V897 TaxID=3446482 RepID=UPI003EDF2F76
MAQTETAILAAGCFWCVEAVFDDLVGVHSVESGYIGGHVDNPTYRQVCDEDTGHAEAVRITFDPAQISYDELLDVFFHIHDPTTLNRQGNDVGEQYRSAIFYLNDAQKVAAEKAIAAAQAEWDDPIVTQVTPATTFWQAEDYHQEYFANNPNQPYCAAVVGPKVRKFREKYAHRLKYR